MLLLFCAESRAVTSGVLTRATCSEGPGIFAGELALHAAAEVERSCAAPAHVGFGNTAAAAAAAAALNLESPESGRSPTRILLGPAHSQMRIEVDTSNPTAAAWDASARQ